MCDARILSLRDGARWLVTVVARVVSEDAAAQVVSARLVVRFEPLGAPPRATRVAILRARSLHAVDDDTLGAVVTRRARRAG